MKTRLYLTGFLVALAIVFGGAAKAEPAPVCKTEVLRLVAFEFVGGSWVARYGC